MFSRLLFRVALFLKRHPRIIRKFFYAFVIGIILMIAAGKTYQNWDDDPDRGAIAITDGAFDESYTTPVYLDQGWNANDSLWFYTTTQGSGLLPYDFFLVLEQEGSSECLSSKPPSSGCLRSNKSIDKFRYLPQKTTFFNPDGLPVGFAKDSYQGKDYLGFTCAACHTGQINYKGTAIRIDGGPGMADMVGFLTALQKAMEATLKKDEKRQRFVDNVIELDNDYGSESEVIQDLKKWTKSVELYNIVNYSHIKYGYGRLDAFGRIYNRVLQHVLNKKQLAKSLAVVTGPTGERLLKKEEIDLVLEGVAETILVDDQFSLVLERLMSTEGDYPGLSFRDILRIRNYLFNEPNAPVSYPFLWDIAQSDYVQWNGLASNAALGPLGRNTGEVIGVFAILDWHEEDPGRFGSGWISNLLTDQERKDKKIKFDSSVNLTNLRRLEAHLHGLQSPQWPDHIFVDNQINEKKAAKGQLIYAEYCQSCHEVIDRDNSDRRVIGKMASLEVIGTDPAMAWNSVNYKGKTGNLKYTSQGVSVGKLILEETAPVVQILTAATKGVIATPDADKWFLRRWAEWVYNIANSLLKNDIGSSIKSGNYNADTTADPYNSLLSYKARSLNGIWATAPYLHNGSVPTLYDLLLPAEPQADDPPGTKYRPDKFCVGSRVFDPEKVGLRSAGYDGFCINTKVRKQPGDRNTGHDFGIWIYGTIENPLPGDVPKLPALTEEQRWQLIEYLKKL